MLRKNQEKKLKLNQPILSVRRISYPSGKDEKREIDDSLNSVLPQPTLYRSESKLDPVRSPGEVPFVWEEIPGIPKDGINPQTNNTNANHQCFDKAVERLCRVKNSEEEEEEENICLGLQGSFKGSKRSVEDYEIYESGDEDEAYLESVVATLSKPKFVYLDCKTGSREGSDEPDRTGQKTRDFMIGLLLPTNKTTASGTHPYAPGKQAVVQELPRVKGNFVRCYQFRDFEEGQASGSDNKHETFPPKVCGVVVPQLCVRSSVFILNPVPAMSVKTRLPLCPGNGMQRYSLARSCTGVNDEQSKSDVSKKKSVVGQKELPGNGRPPQTYEMKDVVQGFAANARIDAMRSCKKFCKKLQELLADRSNSMQEGSDNHVLEKTLHMVEPRILESDSPVTKTPSEVRKGDIVVLTEEQQHKPMVDFSFRDATNERTKSDSFNPLTTGDKFSVKSGRNPVKAYEQTRNCYEVAITSAESENEVDGSNIKRKIITRKLKHSQDTNLEFPASPKSPSDSWLCRTLPSLSTKTSPSRPCLRSENPTSEVESGNPNC